MSKEHAYAYEAGYRDGSIHYELDHCPACKNIADLQETLEENTKLRTLCRDMYLVVEILDMDGMRLQAHGKDADWRTLKGRFDELMGIEVGNGN